MEIDRKSFSFDNLKVLNGLSLQVPPGLSFGLLGVKSAGKTTLVRVLGEAASRRVARLIGYMPQLHPLYSACWRAQWC